MIKEILGKNIFILVLITVFFIILFKQNLSLEKRQKLIDSKLDNIITLIENQGKTIENIQVTLESDQSLHKVLLENTTNNLANFSKTFFANEKQQKNDKNLNNKLLYKENELLDRERKAYKLYKAKEWAKAYKEYDKIRELDPSWLMARYYWVCSRYYSNPMDINSFSEILQEIEYLRSKGISELNLSEIEKSIEVEKSIMRGK